MYTASRDRCMMSDTSYQQDTSTLGFLWNYPPEIESHFVSSSQKEVVHSSSHVVNIGFIRCARESKSPAI